IGWRAREGCSRRRRRGGHPPVGGPARRRNRGRAKGVQLRARAAPPDRHPTPPPWAKTLPAMQDLCTRFHARFRWNRRGRRRAYTPVGPELGSVVRSGASHTISRDVMRELIDRLRSNIASVYLGNLDAVDRVICSLIAKGHVLIEDVPGVGKTVLA